MGLSSCDRRKTTPGLGLSLEFDNSSNPNSPKELKFKLLSVFIANKNPNYQRRTKMSTFSIFLAKYNFLLKKISIPTQHNSTNDLIIWPKVKKQTFNFAF